MKYKDLLKSIIDFEKLQEYAIICKDNAEMNEQLAKIWHTGNFQENPEAFYRDNLLYSTPFILQYPLDEELILEKIAGLNRNSYIYDIARLFRYTYKSVLDFGCGIGHNGFTFAHFGYEVTFADVESPHFNVVRLLRKVLASNALSVTLSGQKDYLRYWCETQYDIILCTQVLEHVRDPIAHLEFFHKHLTNNGLLILETFFDDCSGKAPYHLHENNEYGSVEFWQMLLQVEGFAPLMLWDTGEWRILRKVSNENLIS